MRCTRVALVGLVATWCLAACASTLSAQQKEAVWKPLFDGKTLKGWHEFGQQGCWSVKDGVIVGRSDAPKLYPDLVSDEPYGDFTVRLKFKMISGNSGFYFRSEELRPGRSPRMSSGDRRERRQLH